MRPDQYGIGQVWHRRVREHVHAFRYRLWYCLLDVDQIESRLSQSRWWSTRRFSLVQYRRKDFLGSFDQPLGSAVRDRVEQKLGRRPSGQVFLLTQLRQWGLCFNPVSFYFCYSDQGDLDSIVAEIHNTPWGERFAYVLDANELDTTEHDASGSPPNQSDSDVQFEFDKAFHVSPFLPMDMQYQWRFEVSDDALAIHILVMQQGVESLRTTLRLSLLPLDRAAMRRLPLKFPLQAVKVVGGIYWQAFRLWIKKTTFYSHPKTDIVE